MHPNLPTSDHPERLEVFSFFSSSGRGLGSGLLLACHLARRSPLGCRPSAISHPGSAGQEGQSTSGALRGTLVEP